MSILHTDPLHISEYIFNQTFHINSSSRTEPKELYEASALSKLTWNNFDDNWFGHHLTFLFQLISYHIFFNVIKLCTFTIITIISDIDECAAKPCQNNGTCTDLINDYQCHCPDGFIGTNCTHSKMRLHF